MVVFLVVMPFLVLLTTLWVNSLIVMVDGDGDVRRGMSRLGRSRARQEWGAAGVGSHEDHGCWETFCISVGAIICAENWVIQKVWDGCQCFFIEHFD